MECVFCGIVVGKLPAERLYEDEEVIAFLDIRPLRPGHTLVIPKAHCKDLRDCPAGVLGPLLHAAQRLAPTLLEVTGSDGFNLIVANGESAGQEVFHLHLHLLPRVPKDGFTSRSFRESVAKAVAVSHEELRPLADRIRQILNSHHKDTKITK